MSKMEEFLFSPILDGLCEARADDFETAYILNERNKRRLVHFYDNDPEQDVIDLLIKYVPDEKQREEIRKKMTILEDDIVGDMSISLQRIYKLGFVDGYKMKHELEDLSKEVLNGRDFKKLYE